MTVSAISLNDAPKTEACFLSGRKAFDSGARQANIFLLQCCRIDNDQITANEWEVSNRALTKF